MAAGAVGHRILVTGASGQVGAELVSALSTLGEVFTPAREQMDLASADSIESYVRGLRPRWIVNAAAYTAVDRAESDAESAFAINAEAVRVLGVESRATGAAVIHFSTDYVFDGSSPRPYVETDPTGPLNVYGASKLAGERALLDATPAALVFRTSWVYGAIGKNFLLTILKLARERETLRVVDDQHGAPTWSRDLARLTAHGIAQCEAAAARESLPLADVVGQVAGVYHAAGAGETTWAGFATEALRAVAKQEPGVKLAEVIGIASAEYRTAAARPLNSRLSGAKLAAIFGYRMMDWRESLREVLNELESATVPRQRDA